ncbi:MAG TPA: pyridoxal phosphate-dependent aminotransferase [Xanthobacteraceae bacterium]|nr:pyridoxal phosphate-dependent aminotransferase [Xanthobacteraceae bacterium]
MAVSGIVEAMKHGFGREGMIPLWAGEGDLPTPDFICEAAAQSLKAGETFYTHQRGIPELREALAAYHTRLYGVANDPERYYVVASGMQAIVMAFALILNEGDEVLIPTPSWPNSGAAADAAAARPVFVQMDFGAQGFTLDIARLARAVTPKTRAIFINTPNNPTGWTATREELREILALARRHGLWIVADEVYGRFFYGEAKRAPSFRDVMEPENRILFVNTFSKNWAMTGWRIGWIEADPSLGQIIENLIQASTSGVAVFMQRAAVTALNDGEAYVALQIERARRGREIVAKLGETGRVRMVPPAGAFYQLFAVDGETDSRALCFRLIDEANVGLAPGTAFGPGAEAWLRLCFARSADNLSHAVERLTGWLRR